jgi:hypothetical protein
MAIYWDTSACTEGHPQNKAEAAQREALILVGSSLGISNLTHENLREWFVRMRVWERHCKVERDAWLSGGDLLTVLHRWVGLTLNVEDRSRDQWFSAFYRDAIDDAEYEIDDARPLRAATDQRVIRADDAGAYVGLDDGDTVCCPWE